MAREIELQVNGRLRKVSVDPDTPLLHILRNDLGLKAAKYGCGQEQCGACKVLIDGIATPSCRLPVKSVQGKAIVTLEGLGSRKKPHPLQEAFIAMQAIQCGYCVPGMIISAKSLTDRNPTPTDAEIKAAMSDNLCRCGVYDRVKRAIRYASGLSQAEHSWRLETPSSAPADSLDPEEYRTDGLAGTLAHAPGIDSWIRINTDETVTVFTGKVELGQHIKTALAMVAAEELDLSLERIDLVSGDTDRTPNEWYTAGSLSMETSGNAIRNAAAEARHILLTRAAEQLRASLQELTVSDGTISHPASGKNVTYWELFGGKRFESRVMGDGFLKKPADYRVVRKPLVRDDLVAKVMGEACFVQDLDLPGMVHGRVIRPPNYDATLTAVDETAVSRLPGVLKIVQNGNFLAVITEREEQAISAAWQLRLSSKWQLNGQLPPQGSLFESMKNQAHESYLIVDGMTAKDPPPPIEEPVEAVKTLIASYYRPYQMHASLGPSAAVARVKDGQMTVWSHSQGPFMLRTAIAQVLGRDFNSIRVVHKDGPGCYGHNGADDAGLDAALLAEAFPGRPISLKWTRDDEHAWEPYGPSMIMETQASLDEAGSIIDWNYDVWSCVAMGRPRPDPKGGSGLLAAWHLEKPFDKLSLPSGGTPPPLGSSRNADPLYRIPKKRIVNHVLPEVPLRASALRGLGAYANVFAIESFMDELAHAANVDPVMFRLHHLTDDRARAVIETVARMSGWADGNDEMDKDTGRGIGFLKYKNSASYVAVVVRVWVNRSSGHIVVKKGYIACDAGQVVNPDGVANQLEGAFLQSCSWTLRERVAWDEEGIISRDWNSYPILRFSEAPEIEVTLLDQPGQPYLGVGEGAMGPIPAAIANAVYDAVGIRLRQIPFTL